MANEDIKKLIKKHRLFRYEVHFQILVCPLTISVYIQIQTLAAIGQLLRPKTNRLLYFYWLSGPWHICVLLFVISYHKGTNKKRNQETNKKQKCT